jgi:hypothetical protein
MSGITSDSVAAQEARWHKWQVRYDRANRRSAIQARVVAIVVFAALAAGLLMQFVAVSGRA